MFDSALSRIAALNDTPLKHLKTLWTELYDEKPPSNNRDYLIQHLAYRIQEVKYGGLSDKMQKKLQHMAEANLDQMPKSKADRPPIGTKLIRIYRGVEYQAIVLNDGFEYNGQKFKSLSKLAKHITGTNWNGKVFWGLKK